MANENTIEVQIVLDDGSIQKGFAKIQNQASSSSKEIEYSLGTAFVGAFAAATTAALALKKVLDFTIAGEAIATLNEQFRVLAEREGLAGNAVLSGLQRAADGMTDTEELIKTANGAIAILGKNAERLPEIFELATKAASVFGGTSKEVFDSLVFAVETGNQKALKNVGIILDVDRVYKDFGKTIGLSVVDPLTQAQKQTALLDALLLKGNETFKGITKEISPVANSFQRLKVAIGEVGDSIATTFNDAFGERIAKFNNSLANILNPKAPTAEESINKITGSTKKLEIELAKVKALLPLDNNGEVIESKSIPAILANYKRLQGELAKTKTEYLSLRFEQQQNSDFAEMDAAKALNREKKKQTALTSTQLLSIQDRSRQVQQAILQNFQAELSAREAISKLQLDSDSKDLEQKIIKEERLRLLEQETSLRKLEVNKTFSEELGFSDAQREALRTSITESGARARALIEEQSNEAFIQRVNNTKERLAIIQQGIVNIVTKGVNLFAQALFKGGNAFEDFAKGILGVVADQIIRLGEALIIQGLAIESFIIAINSLLPGSGVAAAAAGVGLVLFGTALKSAIGAGSGGGGGGSFSGGGVSGGDISSPIGGNLAQNPEPEKPQTKIEVNIQGSVFDSDATGSRIVDLINNAFDQNGVQVLNGATA